MPKYIYVIAFLFLLICNAAMTEMHISMHYSISIVLAFLLAFALNFLHKFIKRKAAEKSLPDQEA